MPIGIRGLAAAVGLSTYTVSRALAGHSDVAAETRERIVAKAQELGYTPNVSARMLRRGRSNCVAFVTSRSENGFLDPYFLPVLNGLEATLTAAGLSLLVTGTEDGPDELAIFHKLVNGRSVDAIAISRARLGDRRVEWLQRSQIPFTVLGRTTDAPVHSFLDVDHATGSLEATGWLLDHGHRCIGVINTPASVHSSAKRAQGWLTAHAQRSIEVDPRLMAYGGYTMQSGKETMDALLRHYPLITAVICGNDEVAFGAAQSIAARGLSVGRDISLFGCDDLPIAAMMSPGLTTFRTAQRGFGVTLARQLIAQLAGGAATSELVVPELIWRGSVREAAAGRA